MGLLTRENTHVQGRAGMVAKPAQQFAQVKNGKPVGIAFKPARLETNVGPARKVEHDVSKGFVHRHEGVGVTLEPAPVTKGFVYGLTENNTYVFSEVMYIDMKITPSLDLEKKPPVS